MVAGRDSINKAVHTKVPKHDCKDHSWPGNDEYLCLKGCFMHHLLNCIIYCKKSFSCIHVTLITIYLIFKFLESICFYFCLIIS